ncbi:MAG: hypothetical protein HYV27_00655 [Candidatus Hydrogenedentes bacterium]|nr:hypothetical protein [Candidatus Hydrogenedentota bacterium]
MRRGTQAGLVLLIAVLLSGCYEQGAKRDAYVPSTHAFELHEKALKALRESRVEEALTAIDEALSFDPDYAAAHDTRAKVLARQGNFAEAAAAESEVVRLEPELAEGHIFLGIFLELSGAPGEGKAAYGRALERYEQMLAVKPLDPEGAVNRVIALYLSGGMLEANPVIHQVLEQYPNHAWAQMVRDLVVEDDRAKFLKAVAAPADGAAGV